MAEYIKSSSIEVRLAALEKEVASLKLLLIKKPLKEPTKRINHAELIHPIPGWVEISHLVFMRLKRENSVLLLNHLSDREIFGVGKTRMLMKLVNEKDMIQHWYASKKWVDEL